MDENDVQKPRCMGRYDCVVKLAQAPGAPAASRYTRGGEIVSPPPLTCLLYELHFFGDFAQRRFFFVEEGLQLLIPFELWNHIDCSRSFQKLRVL